MPENPPVPNSINGKVVVLRLVNFGDAEEIHKIFNNKHAVRFWDVPPAKSVEDTLAWISHSQSLGSGFHSAWSVIDKESGKFIGIVSYHDREPWQDRAQLSCIFLEQYLNKQYVGDAFNLLLDFCFSNLKSHRVEIWTDVTSRKLPKILSGLKFRREGILRGRLREGSGYKDVLVQSLLAEQWHGYSSIKQGRDNSELFWRLPGDKPVARNPQNLRYQNSKPKKGNALTPYGFAFPVWLEGDKLQGRNLKKIVTICAPNSVLKTVLKTADGFHTLDEIADNVPAAFSRKDVSALLDGMLGQGILIPSDQRIEMQWAWVRNPPIFSKFIPEGLPEKLARDASAKVSTKSPCGKRFYGSKSHLAELLQKRSSVRQFSGQTLKERELINILYAAYGVLDQRKDYGQFNSARRTVASAGGTYPAVLTWAQFKKSETLEPGIYRVNFGEGRTVSLDLISETAGEALRAIADPVQVTDAHGVLFISSNIALLRSKYGNRAVPYALIEVGEIAQNVVTTGIELGVVSWEIGGFTEKEVQALTQKPECEPLLAIAIGRAADVPFNKVKVRNVENAQIEFAWIERKGKISELFHLARAQLRIGDTYTDWCWGRSPSPLIAIKKSVAEAVERLGCQTPSNVLWTQPAKLKNFIDPGNFVAYPAASYKRKNFPLRSFDKNKKYPCVEISRVSDGKTFWVLADLVYFNNTFGKKYKRPYTSISTSGAAAYPDKEGAVERALMELIERHMFMMTWMGKVVPTRLSFSSLPYLLQARIGLLKNLGWDIHILIVSLGPVISLLIMAQNTRQFMTRVAAASGFDAENIILHALEEVESALPDENYKPDDKPVPPHKVQSTRDHGALYLQKKYFRKADWLLGGKEEVTLSSLSCKSKSSNNVFEFFHTRGMPCYVCDITPQFTSTSNLANGLKVYRVLVEGLLPISFGYGMEPAITDSTFDKERMNAVADEIFPHPFD